MSTENTTHGDCRGTCMAVALPEGCEVHTAVHCRTEEQFDAILAQLLERFAVDVKPPRGRAERQGSAGLGRWIEGYDATAESRHSMTVFWPGRTTSTAKSFDDTIDAQLAKLKFIEVPAAVTA